MKKYLFILCLLVIPITVSAGTLYEYFNKDIPSLSDRAALAEIYGVVKFESDYTGTYEQNVALLRALQEPKEQELGFAPTTGYEERLTATISKTDATIQVSSVKDRDDITLPCSAANKCYFTLEPGTTREESTVCTGISSSSLTSCVRGLIASGESETASTTLQKVHNAGSKIIMTNVAQFFGNFMDLWTTQTATGTKTFITYPEIFGSESATTSRQLLTLEQAQALTNQGAATSTTSIAGISELATQIEMASSTAWGVDEPHVIQSQYATSTPNGTSFSGLYVPVSQNNGYLHQNWFDLSESWTFTGLVSTSAGINSQASSTISLLDTTTASTTNLILYNGANKTTLTATTTQSGHGAFTLPITDGTAGQFLTTNGQGDLGFKTTNTIFSSVVVVNDLGSGIAANVWTDADLSATVGAQSKMVFLKMCNTDPSVTDTYAVRTNGDTSTYIYTAGTQGTGTLPAGSCSTALVKTDSSGIIEWTHGTNNNELTITLLSYW